MTGDQNTAWSIGLGRWHGVSLRIHMLFFVFAVMAFYFGWHATGNNPGTQYYLTAAVAMGVLFASIFIHELAHGLTASHTGGRVESIELFPWGGASEIELPSSSWHRFWVHANGPLSNLGICLLAAAILLADPVFRDHGSFLKLLSPLQPVILGREFFTDTVALVFWINWLLFLINLLPVSPFDGGRIVRSLIPLLWPNTRTDQIYLGSMIVAMMTSIGLCIVAWFVKDNQATTLIPMWLVLILLAIVVFFGARRQTQLDLRDLENLLERERGAYGDKILDAIENRAFDEFDDEDDDQEISDWLWQHKYEMESEDGEDEPAADEEEQLDGILARIKDVGVEGLTEYERFVLLRASARYRERRQTDFTSN